MRRRLPLGALCFALLAGVARPADWPQFGHDAARDGVAADTGLDATTVMQLHVRWHIMLDTVADTAPIVVGHRLFETDRAGTTYAIDVDDGRIVWRFTTHGPNITTSVPAYDPDDGALYVPGVDGALHELDPSTGREVRKRGFPAAITLAPQTEKNASPLTLANGYLYAQVSGYIGDATPYVGHVVAIRLRDGDKHVFNALCSARHELIEPQSCEAQRAGMWSRAGVVVDPDPAMDGRIYAATGNAPYDAAAGDYGDSIVALRADASELIGSLTPANYRELEDRDLDVGSSSPALLPRERTSATPLLAVQAGKDSVLRLIDREHLDAGHATLQTIELRNEHFAVPAIWSAPDRTTLVLVRLNGGVYAYRLVTIDRRSRLTPVWHADLPLGSGDTSPVIGGGIAFVPIPGELIALDAMTGRRVWSGPLGPVHWQTPAIADGVVYCSDENGALTAFGPPAHR